MKLSKLITNSILLSSAVLAASIATVAPASAKTAVYNWDEGIDLRNDDDTNDNQWWGLDNGADNGGLINVDNSLGYHTSITTSFDDVNNILTWNSVFEEKGDAKPQGGWLVLTDGPNPKDIEQEYAIFYMDGVTGTLSAYAYNGQNNSGSYNTNAFLGSWENAVNIIDNGTERSLGFSVDVSSIFDVDAINAMSVNQTRHVMNYETNEYEEVEVVDLDANWKGTGFGEELGVWFHATANPNASYNADGTLSHFTGYGSYFDSEQASLKAQIVTEEKVAAVPEPASMSLLSLSAIGFVSSVLKRRQG